MPPCRLQPLRKGDLIAIISPSARLESVFPTRIARGKSYLESAGYRVTHIHTPTLSTDYETSLKQRCDELHQAFSNPEIKAIICNIGGFSCNEILPYLDYPLIRANHKIFCGFSDITLLHQALYTQSGLQTFYGPAIITNFADYPSPIPFTTDHFFSIVSDGATGPIPRSQGWSDEFLDWSDPVLDKTPRTLSPADGTKWLRPGRAEGVLLGGCMPSFMQTIASPYHPDTRGCVLLLETPESEYKPDVGWSADVARSALTDLRNAGVLGHIAGLVLGRPYGYSEEETKKFERSVLEQCRGFDFPVLANVDVGHTSPILTLPLGARVRLDSERDEFELLDNPVVREG